MTKVIAPNKAEVTAKQIKEQGKTIVLTGGCFDILHKGHIEFLKNAKKQGDFLFVFLESDFNVKKYKGEGRPVNSQVERARSLSSLGFIDYVVSLRKMTKDEDYDKLIFQIRPDIIAATKGDAGIKHKNRQAEKNKAKLVFVIDRISDLSTTKILEKFKYARNINK